MGVIPVMVTGDNWRTARAVAKEVCIYIVYSLLLRKYAFEIILVFDFLVDAFKIWTST